MAVSSSQEPEKCRPWPKTWIVLRRPPLRGRQPRPPPPRRTGSAPRRRAHQCAPSHPPPYTQLFKVEKKSLRKLKKRKNCGVCHGNNKRDKYRIVTIFFYMKFFANCLRNIYFYTDVRENQICVFLWNTKHLRRKRFEYYRKLNNASLSQFSGQD